MSISYNTEIIEFSDLIEKLILDINDELYFKFLFYPMNFTLNFYF